MSEIKTSEEKKQPQAQEAPAQAASTQEAPKSAGRARRRRRKKPANPAAVEVVARGKGARDTNDLQEHRPVAVKEPTVAEDIDFAAFMEQGALNMPQNEGVQHYEAGTRVEAIVEVISPHGPEIFLDLGTKATAYVLKEDVQNEDGEISLKPGDKIEGVVYGQDANGIRIRMRLGREADLEGLQSAFAAKLPVEGKIVATNKGGYEVQIGSTRAFCPHSQMDVIHIAEPETMVGQTHAFRVIEIKEDRSVVVSRAIILREEAAVRGAELMKKLEVGMRVKGRVRSIQSFGAFVDIGGKDGLVHVSELAWSRVSDPHEVVKLGQEVEVVVTDIDREKDKIGLSMRQTQPDPVERLGATLQIGQTARGTVTRLRDFGAFVALGEGVEGMIHVSDLAHYHVRHPKEILKEGEEISVKVMAIDLDKRQFKLSLKALTADPWDGISLRYTPGQEITGTVESIRDFGVFVTIEEGITALLPISESKTEGKQLSMVFRVGSEIAARVLRVEEDAKRMAITRKSEDELQAALQRPPRRRERDRQDRTPYSGGPDTRVAYSDTEDSPKTDGVGSFGAALMAALKKKS